MKNLLLVTALSIGSISAFAHPPASKATLKVTCKTGTTATEAIESLNEFLEDNRKHHLRIQSASAVTVFTDSHSKHHETKACVTIKATRR